MAMFLRMFKQLHKWIKLKKPPWPLFEVLGAFLSTLFPSKLFSSAVGVLNVGVRGKAGVVIGGTEVLEMALK